MPAVVFGDVHGEAAKLANLISQVRAKFGSAVQIYSLGDLIDRGPNSKEVLDICVREGVEGILGNHELWLRNVAAGHDFDDAVYSKVMGGLETIKSYGLYRGDPDRVRSALFRGMGEAQRNFLLNLKPYRSIEVGGRTYWLIHCGLSTSTAVNILDEWKKQGGPTMSEADLVRVAYMAAPDIFYWMKPPLRDPDKMYRFPSGAVQLVGHIPLQSPIVHEHYIALDTGSGTCPPNTLTAVVLHDDGTREFLTAR
jgi:hypothetical protein